MSDLRYHCQSRCKRNRGANPSGLRKELHIMPLTVRPVGYTLVIAGCGDGLSVSAPQNQRRSGLSPSRYLDRFKPGTVVIRDMNKVAAQSGRRIKKDDLWAPASPAPGSIVGRYCPGKETGLRPLHGRETTRQFGGDDEEYEDGWDE